MTASSTKPLSLRELAEGRRLSAASVAVRPYWWDATPRRETPGRPLPAKADVAIVGSGFTGLSAALTLLDNGREAVVLDAGVPGFGASTRNGGQVGSGNQKFRVKRLIELRGEAKAAALLREGTRMLDYIEHLVRSEEIDCHFARCGRFRGAMRPEHYEAMARDMEDLKRVAGVESFMVPRAEQRSEIGSDVFFGGSVLPNDASLHPALYHAGLMQRVEARGGIVIGHAGVRRVARNNDGFLLETDAGPLRCRDVVIATNGYTSGLVPPLRRRIVTVRSGLIATAELPADVMTRLMPKGRVYGNTNRVFYYFRSAPGENRIVWGGRAGRAAGMAAYRHLARDLLAVFPDLGDIAVTHAWDGQIGYTHDELPHLGRMADGLHYAVGYCGTGVSRATYFGHKIALQMVGDPDGRTAFDDLAFPAFPVHPIAKRAVPFVEAWYRFRDYTKL
ncbi:FAD-dependent oxidoreductase [Methyloceanibacter superfactus]|jgi:glycine/D-amino acid oxidase-like deaminating enzyme|uniref:FAD-dependent oxidoreductase n=1 Tax=Methyloceanibacter superfactus TaxID=1774969 RepID=A0A1E3W4T6_9HYPH|nr:FAD-binding oxidoreductase [Methyloceanibacter superfactus]ODS00823.1 FAD-dependent oxidoreductase [Methyloceanibacter superfactus]